MSVTRWAIGDKQALGALGEARASSVVLEAQGRVFKVHVPTERRGRQGGGVRGKVRSYSASSRRRMLERMARVDWEQALIEGVTWLTVTYHDVWPRDPHEQWEQFLALVRRLGGDWALWRRAPQRRGAPHFHALVSGHHAQEEVLQAWQGVTGDISITQVNTQELSTVRAITRYLAKYVAKVEGDVATAGCEAPDGAAPCSISVTYSEAVGDDGDSCGRCWGIIGRANVPWSEAQAVVIAPGRWVWALRRMAARHWEGLTRRKRQGFMVYTADVQAWVRLARYLWRLEGLTGMRQACEGW